MIQVIEDHKDAIAGLCREFGVTRFDVFGSAAEGTFEPGRSDFDFLVEFSPLQNLGPWLSEYFEFKDKLEKLLGCKVDLVMPQAMKNPYFIQEVNRTKRSVYAFLELKESGQ